MAQNQPVKAIDVIPSDTINIPEPGSVFSSTSDASSIGALLVDPTAKFLDDFISGGDVVYVGGNEIHEILKVIDNTQIELKSSVSAAAPYAFKIYKGNGGELKEGQDGYSLFVGTAGDIAVLPVGSGQDAVVLKNVANNSYVPLQVQRVLDAGTTAADILGLE